MGRDVLREARPAEAHGGERESDAREISEVIVRRVEDEEEVSDPYDPETDPQDLDHPTVGPSDRSGSRRAPGLRGGRPGFWGRTGGGGSFRLLPGRARWQPAVRLRGALGSRL